MKHLFIVNPVAGGKDRTEEVAAAAQAVLGPAGLEYEVYVTKAPMDAVDKIRADAAVCDDLRVFACGGDGTLNECVNGAALLPNVSVTCYPYGTGNDFIKVFGDEAERGRFRDLRQLVYGEIRKFDLIETCGRYSVNICSVGADARIGTDVHKYSSIPVLGAGPMAYVTSLVVNVFKGLNQHVKVRCGDFEYEGQSAIVTACNGQYYGGGFRPSVDARPDSRNLEFFIVKEVKLHEFVGLIGKYSKGNWREIPEDKLYHVVGNHIEIETPEPVVVNVDGEALYSDHINFTLVPAAVNFIVPKGLKLFAAN